MTDWKIDDECFYILHVGTDLHLRHGKIKYRDDEDGSWGISGWGAVKNCGWLFDFNPNAMFRTLEEAKEELAQLEFQNLFEEEA